MSHPIWSIPHAWNSDHTPNLGWLRYRTDKDLRDGIVDVAQRIIQIQDAVGTAQSEQAQAEEALHAAKKAAIEAENKTKNLRFERERYLALMRAILEIDQKRTQPTKATSDDDDCLHCFNSGQRLCDASCMCACHTPRK